MSLDHLLCIGKKIIRLDDCLSTNAYAKNLSAKSTPIEGTTIITANQTAGKGQYGNTWQSTAHKNLTFSVLIHPKMLSPNEQFYISIMTSLACVSFLEKMSEKSFQIKWPNDIYHKDKKIGGILIENQLQQRQITQSIIGIGLNINQEKFENLPQAISLTQIEGKIFTIEKCYEAILIELDKYYLQLRQGKQQELLNQYYQKMLGYQEQRKFIKNNEQFEAKVEGISPTGELHLITKGTSSFFGFKEVEWIF
ncbi:MAG: biotin--[acetyl-CoA-carboxylase] ligase [Chitinophagales bacterium]